MRKVAYTLLTIALAVAPQLQADEIVPFGYVSIPFGNASNSRPAPSYGFSLAQAQTTTNEAPVVNLFDTDRPALADLRFQGAELSAFEVNGVNSLTEQITYNADGTQTTELVWDWKPFIIGLTGVAILWGILDGGGGGHDGCSGKTKCKKAKK